MYGTEWESYHNHYLHFLYKLKTVSVLVNDVFVTFILTAFLKSFLENLKKLWMALSAR